MSLTKPQPCVLVVGATGQMGRKIVRELCALGRATVRAMHRDRSSAESVDVVREAGAELVVADLSDEGSLERACSGVNQRSHPNNEVHIVAVKKLRIAR